MKTRLALLVTTIALAAGPLSAIPARAQHDCDRTSDHAVPLPTEVSVPDSRVRVIVPAGYCHDTSAYPVVLLLHGVGDTWETWSTNVDVEAISADDDVIIVMPDGGKGSEAGWYSDWADGSRQWETFHTQVLVDWVDANFRTLGDGHRATAGLSMGGFGALSYAARNDNRFQAAASFSGFADTMYGWPVNGFGYEAAHGQFGTPDDRVWGDHIEDEDKWRAHNPADRATDLDDVALFIATGTGTPGGHAGEAPTNPGAYAIEHFIFQTNVSLVAHLEAAGVGYSEWIYPGGYHGWPYWAAALDWALPRLVAAIS